MTGEAIPIFLDLVDRGIIRVLDALIVQQNEDGTVSGFEATDLDGDSIGDLKVFEGASTGLLGEEDAAAAGEMLEPGSAAVMIVYENRWAAPGLLCPRRIVHPLQAEPRCARQCLQKSVQAFAVTSKNPAAFASSIS